MNKNVLCIGGPLDGKILVLPSSQHQLVAPFMDDAWQGGYMTEGDLTLSSPPTISYRIRMLSIPNVLGQRVHLRVALAPWLENDLDEAEARIRRNEEVMGQLRVQARAVEACRVARRNAKNLRDQLESAERSLDKANRWLRGVSP